MIWHLIVEGGWRSAAVAAVITLSIVASMRPSARDRATPLARLSLALGGLLTIDLSASGIHRMAGLSTPAGEIVLFSAVLDGLGPLAVALVGFGFKSLIEVARGLSTRSEGQDAQGRREA